MTLSEVALIAIPLGLRHGFDYDHIAAISDISSLQVGWKRSMKLGLLYAIGHAITLFVLTVPIMMFSVHLPALRDSIADRLVGITLIVMSIFVFVTLATKRPSNHVPRSRIAWAISSFRWSWWRIRNGLSSTPVVQPVPFNFKYDKSSVLGVGAIHGLGAETPTQIAVLLLAANLGGPKMAFIALLAFMVGMLTMNTLMTASASGLMWWGDHDNPKLRWGLNLASGIYSLSIGLIFIAGYADCLPTILK